MNVIINDKTCVSSVGQTLLKAARINHSHVGYVCGGHGVCQTCFVIVLEGSECLSPLNDVEKTFLSPHQIRLGGRMACRAVIAKEGTIRILSRPEEVRRMFLSNPMPLFSYGAEMGSNFARQVIPGIGNIMSRIVTGEIVNENELEDLKESVDGLIGLAVETLPEYLPFKEQVMGIVSKLPVQLPSQIQLPLPFQLPVKIPFLQETTRKNTQKPVPIRYIPRNTLT
ncbi:2Fe-2S iron-sulfur cluster-binding protein [Chlorobium limicola]